MKNLIDFIRAKEDKEKRAKEDKEKKLRAEAIKRLLRHAESLDW